MKAYENHIENAQLWIVRKVGYFLAPLVFFGGFAYTLRWPEVRESFELRATVWIYMLGLALLTYRSSWVVRNLSYLFSGGLIWTYCVYVSLYLMNDFKTDYGLGIFMVVLVSCGLIMSRTALRVFCGIVVLSSVLLLFTVGFFPEIQFLALGVFFAVLTGYVTFSHRITVMSLVTQQQSQLLASSRLAALGEMAGGIAHEINNPLAIIDGRARQLTSMARMGSDSKQIESVALNIQKTTERISRITSALLQFARRDRSEAGEEVFSIETTIQNVIALCGERFRSYGVELIVPHIPLDLKVRGQSTLVSQVLLNLLNNAFDAAKDGDGGRWVQVEVEHEISAMKLKVSNSGTRIPPELRERIFEPFFTTKPIGRGTGLGLSLSLGIVQSMGGKIFVDPKSDATTFVVEVPTLSA